MPATHEDIIHAFDAAGSGANHDAVLNAFDAQAAAKEPLSAKLGEKAGAVAEAGKGLVQDLGDDLEDTGRGIAQGATMGFADEIAGVGGAVKDKLAALFHSKEAEDFAKLYRKHQQESEAAFEKSKARSPWLYGAGELGGAVGAGLLTSGAGFGVGAAGGLGRAALTGAAMGVVGGIGSSKGHLVDATPTEQAQVGADAIGGGLAGGALGAVGKYATDKLSPAFSKIANWAKKEGDEAATNSPLLRQMRKSFGRGLSGEKINDTDTVVSKLTGEGNESINGLTRQMLDVGDKLGAEVGAAYDAAKQAGVKIDVMPQISQAVSELSTAQASGRLIDNDVTGAAINLLDKYRKTRYFDPDVAKQILPDIQNLINNTTDDTLKQILIKAQKDVKNNIVTSVPGLAEANARFNQFRTAGPETVIGKGVPAEFNDTWLGDMKHMEGKLRDANKTLLENYTRPGSVRTDAVYTVDQLMNNLGKYEESHPGVLANKGLQLDTLKNQIRDKADDLSIVRQALGQEPQHGELRTLWGIAGGGAQTGRGQLIQKSNVLGRAVKSVGESSFASVGNKLYNLPDDVLGSLASGLKNRPITQSLGEALERGLQDKNQSLKNAALFSILQNPSARLLISGEDIK